MKQDNAIASIDKKLLEGMQITHQIAAARNQSEKLNQFIRLVTTYYLGGAGTGIVRRKKRVLAARRNLQSQHINALKKARDGDAIGGHQVTVIPIHQGGEIVLLTKQPISPSVIEAIPKLAESFKLELRSKARYFMIPALLLATLTLPITDKVTGKGIVIGEQGWAVTATANGIVNKINAKNGAIRREMPILNIQTLIDADIHTAQTQLNEINTKILEQGANSTENINLLHQQHNTAAQKLRSLKDQAQLNQVVANMDGILELEENILGAIVQRGDTLGVIEKATQQMITTEVAAGDWIPLEVGGMATFIGSGETQVLPATIESIPLSQSEGSAGLVYKIKIHINEALPTGTQGTIILHGEPTRLGWWLFRDQIGWLISVLG